MDDEDKKKYYKMTDKAKRVVVRLSPDERTLLETMMRSEEWENVSGFIKSKLFGRDPEKKVEQLINRKDTDELVILLRNYIFELTDQLCYFKERYEKDMAQLWQEEGVDVEEWMRKTNRWYSEAAKASQETLTICRKVAKALRLDGYFEMPSDKMVKDLKKATKQEKDNLSKQIFKERIAHGYDSI